MCPGAVGWAYPARLDPEVLISVTFKEANGEGELLCEMRVVKRGGRGSWVGYNDQALVSKILLLYKVR